MEWKTVWKVFSMSILLAVCVSSIVILGTYCSRKTNLETRIEYLTTKNSILEKRQDKTTTTFVKEDVTTTTSFDQVYVDILEEYNVAQTTYIALLQGLLTNNGVAYPEFMFEKLLEETQE